ncbi:uncharacterized protein UV8b_03550 [Ustilaginoidea virens]|uniref:Large ribosomal subunit protein mL46 n=1 Tax=Ustilaginoidea virens TaxID=1159556 RepID=A0A8E5HPJ3_USTVR|nr:uncharacterized protein UV8b_03550 [Ustilaginoidea virens]QUC19309.1 hypothetical protein UV8b_03550 [Ustilaginoidea virens]
MAASSRGRRALGSLIAGSSTVCSRCATTSARAPSRLYSATAAAGPASPSSEAAAAAAVAAAAPPPCYDVRSGLVLTRPPLLTRKLHPFENAFFFYQKRLEERLNTPFVTSIYFKPDTARRLDWNLKVGERRGTVAKDIGVYSGKSARAWDDELRAGDPLSGQDSLVDSLLRDAEARVSDDAEVIPAEDVVPVERPAPRETEADRAGDLRRLDRQLDRTLYLVVRGAGGWEFPADLVAKHENLHEAARRVMDQAAGVNMNTWIVGRVPVAHVVEQPVRDGEGLVQTRGRKTFFLKARIMAGQADLHSNPFGYTDFRWLTREELREQLPADYFRGVRNMMSDR